MKADARKLGIEAYKAGQWSDAVKHLSTFVPQSPDDVDARLAFALSLTRLGENSKALIHVNRLLKLSPDSPKLQRLRDQILDRAEKDIARKEIEVVEEPDSVEVDEIEPERSSPKRRKSKSYSIPWAKCALLFGLGLVLHLPAMIVGGEAAIERSASVLGAGVGWMFGIQLRGWLGKKDDIFSTLMNIAMYACLFVLPILLLIVGFVARNQPSPTARLNKALEDNIRLLQSQQADDKYKALIALTNLPPNDKQREVSSTLDELMQGKDVRLKIAALMTCKKWGTKANLPVLRQLAERSDPTTKRLANEAIAAIEQRGI